MERKHTPGPWSVANLDVRSNPSAKHPMGKMIADCYRQLPEGHFDNGENAANARLIAAAPDMLEALELCLERLEVNNFGGEEEEYIQQVQNAIALATGQTADDSGEVV